MPTVPRITDDPDPLGAELAALIEQDLRAVLPAEVRCEAEGDALRFEGGGGLTWLPLGDAGPIEHRLESVLESLQTEVAAAIGSPWPSIAGSPASVMPVAFVEARPDGLAYGYRTAAAERTIGCVAR